MNASRRFRPLRQRLLRRLFWLALCCGGLAISGQIWLVYQQETREFEAGVDEIGRTHLPLLAVGLWDVEIDALQQQVEGIAARKEVAAVVLQSGTGLHIASAGFDAFAAEADAVLAIQSPRDPGEVLGELRIHADSSQLDRAILLAAGQKILEIALYTGLISLLIGYSLHRELHVPLKRIAAYAAGLSPFTKAAPPSLRRGARDWFDEMDLVNRGFQTLHEGLVRHEAERDEAMQALAAERDLLDRRVARRTEALQRISGYQAILSRTLLRCLHLRADGFAPALQQALEELCGFLGARACAMAERDRTGPWRWRLVRGSLWRAGETVALPDEQPGWSQLHCEAGKALLFVRHDDSGGGQLFILGGELQTGDADEQRYLQMVAEMLFSLLDRWQSAEVLERTQAELERLSLSDPLTGLGNRRLFEQSRQQESRRALRHGQPLSLLMLDVDYFKAYNDQHGHGAGDDCLVRIAECIRQLFQRVGEVAVRLGGEEFAVVLPGYDDGQALAAAERVRAAVQALALPHHAAPLGHVSVSLGCASWAPELDEPLDFEQLLERADRALYQAKSAGRNRVRSARPALSAP